MFLRLFGLRRGRVRACTIGRFLVLGPELSLYASSTKPLSSNLEARLSVNGVRKGSRRFVDGAGLTIRRRECFCHEFQTIFAWYLSRASGMSRRIEGMKLKKTRKKTALLLLSLMAMLVIPATPVVPKAMGATGSFDNLVVILMENNGYCDVATTCGGSGSYETSLAQTYSIAGSCQSDSSCSSGGYSAIDHPSEGNYVQLISGDDYGFTGDCGYCPARTSAANIIDRIEASGRTWDAWY